MTIELRKLEYLLGRLITHKSLRLDTCMLKMSTYII